MTKVTETEEKIKEAARKLFQQKGFEGTKTREIADLAGINLALLNYYFRSKKKLYEIIMMETLEDLFTILEGILQNTQTTVHEKLQQFVNLYIDFLSQHPDVPIFVICEVRQDPGPYLEKLGLAKRIKTSFFAQQLQAHYIQHGMPSINPIHLLMNLIALTIFPIIAAPMLQNAVSIGEDHWVRLMTERKNLIPLWIRSMTQNSQII